MSLSPVPCHDPISAAYSVLAQAKGYRNRPAQQQLSRDVADAIRNNEPLICEAPTGSGKTIGYAIGALVACREEGLPLVISTATVSLQRQIMESDLPRVERTGLLKKEDYRLIRGRQRFYCPVMADGAQHASSAFQKDLFAEKQEVKAEDRYEAGKLAGELAPLYESGEWSGIVDDLPAGMPVPPFSVWGHLAANADTCLRSTCSHYDSCPYFREREQWAKATVLVANHSLVLLDLLSTANGGEPVFPFEAYALMLDEAHHLPEKALDTARSSFRPGTLLGQLDDLDRVIKAAYGNKLVAHLLREQVPGKVWEEIAGLKREALALIQGLAAHGISSTSFDSETTITPGEEQSAAIAPLLATCATRLAVVVEQVGAVANVVANTIRKGGQGLSTLFQLNSALGALSGGIRAQHLAAESYATQPVVWMSSRFCPARPDKWEPVLNGSPLESSAMLNAILWGQADRVRVAMVSATLRGTSGFTHFAHEVALSDKPHRTKALPSPFDYKRATLYQADLQTSPGQDGFMPEMLKWLELLLEDGVRNGEDMGTLVLFTNRRALRAAYAALKPIWGEALMAQGENGSAAQMRALHSTRIDKGQRSVLFGLKSLAEGFDLPGDYCTHVIVTQVPFESPVDPVQVARQLHYGKPYFSQHILPKVSRELQQIVGRLLRREDDWGRITVLDRRLWTMWYGAALRRSLPGYQRGVLTLDEAGHVIQESTPRPRRPSRLQLVA